jgi:predicted RNA-binding Zn-ribbon protein involved in translation (DUF1610 family)
MRFPSWNLLGFHGHFVAGKFPRLSRRWTVKKLQSSTDPKYAGVSIMALYDRKCPSCGAVIPQKQTPIWQSQGFPCPVCGRLLRTSLGDLKLSWAVTLAISLGGCLYFGLRGSTALLVSLIASVPLSLIVHSIFGLIFSHPLELFPNEKEPRDKADP